VRSRDVLAHVERQFQWRTEKDQLSAGSKPSGSPEAMTVLLEDIRSLWNVGSIFRTADGAGFSRLFLCGITGCPPRKEIAKTSLGAEDTIAWQFHRNALEVLLGLKSQGVTIIGLERTAESIPLSHAVAEQNDSPICLVLGNEVTGISLETLSLCDVVCDLPMRGTKESLNVAVAFGIAAYMIADRQLGSIRRRMDACEETR
jgi:23S rRNA (guanosine2251-2'-O)-methyltransferase